MARRYITKRQQQQEQRERRQRYRNEMDEDPGSWTEDDDECWRNQGR